MTNEERTAAKRLDRFMTRPNSLKRIPPENVQAIEQSAETKRIARLAALKALAFKEAASGNGKT